MLHLLAETSLLELVVVAASVAYALFRAVGALRDKSKTSAELGETGAEQEETGVPGEVEVRRIAGEVERDLADRLAEADRRVARVEIAQEELSRKVSSADFREVERLKSLLLELDQRIASVSQQSKLSHAKVMRQFREFLGEEKEKEAAEKQGEESPPDRSEFALGDLFDVHSPNGGDVEHGPRGISAIAPIASHGRRRRRLRR